MNLTELSARIAEALIAAKKSKSESGEVFRRSHMDPVILRVLELNTVIARKNKKGMPTVRKRDEIFDLLSKIDGQDPDQLTRHGAARIGTAKKQILEVLHDKTTVEVVEEIEQRWAVWCKKHFDAKTRTVMALVTHWAELGGGRMTKIQALDPYQNPDWDWRKAMGDKYPGTPFVEDIAEKVWSDISVDVRKLLLTERRDQRV